MLMRQQRGRERPGGRLLALAGFAGVADRDDGLVRPRRMPDSRAVPRAL
jgi:hypothetical protein